MTNETITAAEIFASIKAAEIRSVPHGCLPFGRMDIRPNVLMSEPYVDWSRVRSPGRARRRLRLGHRQNIVVRQMPNPNIYLYGNSFHAHPETIRRLMDRFAARQDAIFQVLSPGALFP